jgi:hypothetical protein
MRPDDPRPRRGRPRTREPGMKVAAWVPMSTFDALTALAMKHQTSMSKVVKACILVQLRKPDAK